MIITRDEAYKTVCELRTPINDSKCSIGNGMFVGTQIIIVTREREAESLLLPMFGNVLNWKHHNITDISVFPILFSFDVK